MILRQFLLICLVLLTSVLYIQYEKDHKKAVQVMGKYLQFIKWLFIMQQMINV